MPSESVYETRHCFTTGDYHISPFVRHYVRLFGTADTTPACSLKVDKSYITFQLQ
jgi:hypothetical protein